MSWLEKTTIEYVFRGAQIGIRKYTYEYRQRWWHRFIPYRAAFLREFDTIETTVNGDLFGHLTVLANPDFSINDYNVMAWAKEAVYRGHAKLEFSVTYELMSGRESIMMLDARFSDRRTAMLFKLTFG